MQVWQTPDRQLQREGTPQASASSSTLRRLLGKGADMPLRAKVTWGPVPGGPDGGWGERLICPVIPGLRDAIDAGVGRINNDRYACGGFLEPDEPPDLGAGRADGAQQAGRPNPHRPASVRFGDRPQRLGG